jgi:hypothetical protein
MPAKKTKDDQPYTITGKTFAWQPLDDDDERGTMPVIEIPMRVKLKVIRELAGRDLDADSMFAILEKLIPHQAEVLDEMDLNDFQAMFMAWQKEYEALSGASLGE